MKVSLLAFLAAAAVLTVTPGLDTVLVLRTAVTRGGRAAFVAGLGVCSGLLVWGAATAIGASALLAASSVAYDVLRLVGAAYLIWLGVRALRSAGEALAPPPRLLGGPYRTGLLTNVLNPKIGAFYLTFLPQFVPDGAPVLPFTLLLAGVHATLGLVWFAGLVRLVSAGRHVVERPAVRRRLEQVSGLVFVGLGARLALDRR